ncbi:hypothetical protein Pan241w_48380 [Gimesia alba]|uniref:Uncharacterized protein n=1 Tax=Gimesia alba TaxID=2527973 RepID=A0A517RLM5_9PLAN|nr:hypothetical protein [Gimesia alba]QDT44722.1 hypothetical protein Pan241w_48380 [Gimesia alba]
MNQSDSKVYIYNTVDGEMHHYYVSPLSHDLGFTTGLPSEAIMGELTNGPENITPEFFQQNTQFLEFLAGVIGKHAIHCPGLIAETERQQNGYVFILDRRTPTPEDGVPPEDIIGYVEIKNGQMLQFHSSPNYRIFTKDGFMKLERWMHERLLEELKIVAGVSATEDTK